MIKIFSKPGCPHCDSAENYLKEYGFQFTKINVVEDEEALAFIKSKGHKTVPQIYYDNRLLVEGGFSGLSKITPADLRIRIQQAENGRM